MAYEVFRKTKERRKKRGEDQPLMVSMDKQGRLMIHQSFYKVITNNAFKKTEILIDYESQKIGLRMLSEEGSGPSVKTLTIQPHKSRRAFLSFVTVKKALNLPFPFIRHAKWNEDEQILEFVWVES